MNDDSLGLPDRRWLKRALAFNLSPASYIHDSWLDTLPNGELLRQLRGNRRVSSRLSRHLLESFGLAEDYWYDFTPPGSRLALLDSAALEQIYLLVGVTLRSGELRHVIDGAKRKELRLALGDDAMTFAAKRVPFFGQIPDFAYEPQVREPRARLTLIGLRYCTGADRAAGAATTRFHPHSRSRELARAPNTRHSTRPVSAMTKRGSWFA